MDAGANVMDRQDDGKTALHIASENSETKAVLKLLLEILTAQTSRRNGGTALHWAVDSGDQEIVKMVLDAGTSIRALNLLAETAMHRAVEAQPSSPGSCQNFIGRRGERDGRGPGGKTCFTQSSAIRQPRGCQAPARCKSGISMIAAW